MRKLIILMLVLFLIPTVTAISFPNEKISQDVTSFKWCSDNYWGKEKISEPSYWTPYVDNYGCEGVKIQVLYEAITTDDIRLCTPSYQNCTTKEEQDKNSSTYYNTTCQTVPEVCIDTLKYGKEYYDLATTSANIEPTGRICVVGTRSGVSQGKCDMNFHYDDGTEDSFSAIDYNKAWWNQTWNRKTFFNATSTTDSDSIFSVFLISLNSTQMQDCQTDGGDIRIVNATEDGTIPFNLSTCNSAGCNIRVNSTVNLTGYVYCNTSTTTITTSQELKVLRLNNSITSSYDFEQDPSAANPNPTDELGNNDGSTSPLMNVGQRAAMILDNGWYYDKVDDFTNFTNDNELKDIGTGDFTISFWTIINSSIGYEDILVKTSVGNTAGFLIYYETRGGQPCQNCVRFNSFGNASAAHTGTGSLANNALAHVLVKRQAGTVTMWINGSNLGNTVQASDIKASEKIRLNTDHSFASRWGNAYDELHIWSTRAINDSEIASDFNGGQGISYPFYAEPTLEFGESTPNLFETSVDTGLYNSSNINISLNIDERFDFTSWINYTYDDNSSVVGNETAFCNYSVDGITDPNTVFVAGDNDTVCESGCEFTNRSEVFSLESESADMFIQDQYEFELCHVGNPRSDFHVATNCSNEQYDFNFADIPLCSAGSQLVRIISGNCSSTTEVNISVWSDAAGVGNALTVVNNSIRLDRTHNHSEQYEYNDTLEVFVDDDLHHFDITGTHTFNMSCFSTAGDVENQSVSMVVTVGDLPPTVIIDSIWWWLESEPVSFTDDIVGKYPLEETVNISSSCSNGDLDTIIHYLNYTNGTNIYTHDAGNVNVDVNYTQGNFTVNENRVFQTWCNDTVGNASSSQLTFNTSNLVPTVSWVNSSPLITTVAPFDINWTFSDSELESTADCYLFINATNFSDPNVTGTALGYSFNLAQDTWNFTVRCEDSFFNSSAATLIVTFSQAITFNSTQPEDSVSYLVDGTILNWQFTTLNDADNCTARLNDFQNITYANCTSGANNVTFIDGFNEWRVCFHSSTTSDECSVIRFWVQDSDRELQDYMPILLWMLIIGLMFVMGEFLKMPFIQLLTGFMFIIFIVYWWAFFNTWYIPIIFTFIGIVLIMRSVAILWTD